jgi:hypothetical protein
MMESGLVSVVAIRICESTADINIAALSFLTTLVVWSVHWSTILGQTEHGLVRNIEPGRLHVVLEVTLVWSLGHDGWVGEARRWGMVVTHKCRRGMEKAQVCTLVSCSGIGHKGVCTDEDRWIEWVDTASCEGGEEWYSGGGDTPDGSQQHTVVNVVGITGSRWDSVILGGTEIADQIVERTLLIDVIIVERVRGLRHPLDCVVDLLRVQIVDSRPVAMIWNGVGLHMNIDFTVTFVASDTKLSFERAIVSITSTTAVLDVLAGEGGSRNVSEGKLSGLIAASVCEFGGEGLAGSKSWSETLINGR